MTSVSPFRWPSHESLLRTRREITASWRLLIGRYDIVPLAVEFLVRDVDSLHLLVSDLHAFRIEVAVDLAAYLEASFGCRGPYELDNHLVTDQRLAAPILGDEGEQPVLDLVPFAGSGRQVVHNYSQASLVGEPLEFAFPELHAGAVAAAAVP